MPLMNWARGLPGRSLTASRPLKRSDKRNPSLTMTGNERIGEDHNGKPSWGEDGQRSKRREQVPFRSGKCLQLRAFLRRPEGISSRVLIEEHLQFLGS